jgi:putative copper resistance protein D
MTGVSLAVGLAGAPFFLSAVPEWQVAGALLFLLHSILDGCDGEIARLKFLESSGGARPRLLGRQCRARLGVRLHGSRLEHRVGLAVAALPRVVAVASTLVAAFAVEPHKVDAGPAQSVARSAGARMADALANRDFIYLIIALAAFGRSAWFLVLVAVGTPVLRAAAALGRPATGERVGVTGFIDVLLRGMALCGQAAAIGGVPVRADRPQAGPARAVPSSPPFSVASWSHRDRAPSPSRWASSSRWVSSRSPRRGAWLAHQGDHLHRLLRGERAARAGVRGLHRGRAVPAPATGVRGWWAAMAVFTVALATSSAAISHAAARIEHGGTLRVMDALHQYAASAWVGWTDAPVAGRLRASPRAVAGIDAEALFCLGPRLGGRSRRGGIRSHVLLRRRAGAFTGTAYGMMVMTKMVVLGLLLILGALNFFVVRRLPADDVSLLRLRRFVEVELGLGITVLFAAASLTSLPPAVDVVADRATMAEVAHVFTPRLPSFTSSKLEDMPLDDRWAPRTDADRQWSEFNHHVAGAFVLVMGVLAIAYRMGWAPWARHWPLVFFGLAAFLLVRNDPGSWPLGPQTFWEGNALLGGGTAPHLCPSRAGLRHLRVDGAHGADSLAARRSRLPHPVLGGRRPPPDPLPCLAESQGGIPDRGDPRPAGRARHARGLGAAGSSFGCRPASRRCRGASGPLDWRWSA